MSLKGRFVEALLRSYPAEWRRECGAELVDLLATHTLGVPVVVDVLWSGFQQRMRSLEPNQYEKPVSPVPDPNGWFKLRVVT